MIQKFSDNVAFQAFNHILDVIVANVHNLLFLYFIHESVNSLYDSLFCIYLHIMLN